MIYQNLETGEVRAAVGGRKLEFVQSDFPTFKLHFSPREPEQKEFSLYIDEVQLRQIVEFAKSINWEQAIDDAYELVEASKIHPGDPT